MLKLTYFDFNGGRGEPARLALAIGGIPFVDERLPGPQWPERKGQTPYGSLPTLEVDGEVIAQSNAILHYVGRLAGLYPADALDAARCDEILAACEALNQTISGTFGLSGDALRTHREQLVDGAIRRHLETFARRLRANGWFAEHGLTVADLRVAELVRWFGTGRLDHVPTDVVARFAPALLEHRARIVALPAVQAWAAAHTV